VTPYRVWTLLDLDEGTEVKVLMHFMGLSRSAIYKALQKLESAGMATNREGLWYRVETDLDYLAEFYGISERRARKKARHAADRVKRQQKWEIENYLKRHREHDLVGDIRNTEVDPATPALTSAQRSEDAQTQTGIPRGQLWQEGVGAGSSDAIQRADEEGVWQPQGELVGHSLGIARGNRESGQGFGEGDASLTQYRPASCQNGCDYHEAFSGASIQPYRCPHCHGPLRWDDPSAREGGPYRLDLKVSA
jgi:predicted transcriptional regulator